MLLLPLRCHVPGQWYWSWPENAIWIKQRQLCISRELRILHVTLRIRHVARISHCQPNWKLPQRLIAIKVHADMPIIDSATSIDLDKRMALAAITLTSLQLMGYATSSNLESRVLLFKCKLNTHAHTHTSNMKWYMGCCHVPRWNRSAK